MGGDDPVHLGEGKTSGRGDAGGLTMGVGRRDLRIKAGPRRGDRIHRGRAAIRSLPGAAPGRHLAAQRRRARAEVRGARGHGAERRGRGARMQIARAGEVLCDQPRADHGAVLHDQAAVGGGWHQRLCDRGDRQRIGEAGEKGHARKQDKGGAELGQHGSLLTQGQGR
ncbi:hypothetical protein SDC9_32066 [bioreactor metagenome]|uniref:Uncharacterized protein n=1 Tax=bioreactor metagenome TaxID=1076179 RepID=A0A644V428_9ZZZZ